MEALAKTMNLKELSVPSQGGPVKVLTPVDLGMNPSTHSHPHSSLQSFIVALTLAITLLMPVRFHSPLLLVSSHSPARLSPPLLLDLAHRKSQPKSDLLCHLMRPGFVLGWRDPLSSDAGTFVRPFFLLFSFY